MMIVQHFVLMISSHSNAKPTSVDITEYIPMRDRTSVTQKVATNVLLSEAH
jgi:hypothetical protein